MKNSIKTLAVWLIIGIIFIVLLTSIVGNSDTKLAYSELVAKIESGEVKEIEIDSRWWIRKCKIKKWQYNQRSQYTKHR